MKLKFKRQQYQENATNAVIRCFEGQTKGEEESIFYTEKILSKNTLIEKKVQEEQVVFRNKKLEITPIDVRNNIRKVQIENGIEHNGYTGIDNFSIEMETGTGKTYTYINTIYELNQYYGWSKFIIMVPSIAIREGVEKSFEITQEHFQEIYQKKIRYFVYNSNKVSNLSNINAFASDSDIQVMIISFQAFNAKSKSNRKIYEELDELQSRRPIDVLKSTNPIVIIDEPQKFGDQAEELLREFNPLFILRYSATHKKEREYNKVYRLDAVDAYNAKLVKKISVKGIEFVHNKAEDAYVFLDYIEISKKSPQAVMEIEKKFSSGVRKITKNFKQGDDLYKLSGELEQYKGFKIAEINAKEAGNNKVCFKNGIEIQTGQILGDKIEASMPRIQIRETIRSHFRKEKEYYLSGIKVLSLFFIDEVSKYKIYDENKQTLNGEYAKIFEEEYQKVLQEEKNSFSEKYRQYLDSLQGEKIHSGYFSIDKKASKSKEEIIFTNPKIDDRKEGISSDEDAYNLIMKDKERLLSLEEPVRFIFSHSALREGWDNPNIFQICTLKKSSSEISKRQEIGRGLRICVNTEGERMDYKLLGDSFHDINTLTVVASESYESFARALQEEISSTLSQRFANLTPDILMGRALINEKGEKYQFDSIKSMNFVMKCIESQYVDASENYRVTEKCKEDLRADKMDFITETSEWWNFKTELVGLMKKMFLGSSGVPVEIENNISIRELIPNANFNEEFKKFWQKINKKTMYEVELNTEELIKKAVETINQKVRIAKVRLKVTEGSQKEVISYQEVKEKTSMKIDSSTEKIYEGQEISTVKYDLVGSLAKETQLTRKTIIEILKGIDRQTFAQYAYNPEEFIRQVGIYINSEKAEMILKGISYQETGEAYRDSIFTVKNVKGKLGDNAIETNRSIYDYLIVDSDNEKAFADRLETGDVLVYAKLPRTFKIPTPLGNYTPDWMVILSNPEFDYQYFIAETKGRVEKEELRKIEEAKTECARKHFATICGDDVKYGVVDSYEKMIDKVTNHKKKTKR